MTYYQQQVQALQASLYPHPEVGTQLRQARQFITQRFADPITLTEVAAVACFSRFHFLRLFRRYYGCTPHDYLREVRLRHARHMLAAGLSARQACFATGFSSVSSFTTLFRQWAGCPPAAYRTRQLRNFEEASLG